MKNEVKSAVDFLSNILRNKRNITPEQMRLFHESMLNVMNRHYEDHWFPEKPFKGSGYRCIRINHHMDPMIAQAGFECGLSSVDLFTVLPRELTMWIDPAEVSYRIGEDGSICVLYEEGETEPSPDLSPAQSSMDIFQSCGDQLRQYYPETTSDIQQFQDYLATAFVAS